jgi:hypothetical protein
MNKPSSMSMVEMMSLCSTNIGFHLTGESMVRQKDSDVNCIQFTSSHYFEDLVL